MIRFPRVKHGDKLYFVIKKINEAKVQSSDNLKDELNADIILRKFNELYFCKEVTDATFEDVQEKREGE